jgi:argininosuccinate lyase
VSLTRLDAESLARHAPAIAPADLALLTAQASVEARATLGGTAPGRVAAALEAAAKRLSPPSLPPPPPTAQMVADAPLPAQEVLS